MKKFDFGNFECVFCLNLVGQEIQRLAEAVFEHGGVKRPCIVEMPQICFEYFCISAPSSTCHVFKSVLLLRVGSGLFAF